MTREIKHFFQSREAVHYRLSIHTRPIPDLLSVFRLSRPLSKDTRGSQVEFPVTGSRLELFHLAAGSHSALCLYRVLHLAIYPAVLLVPTERARDALSSSISGNFQLSSPDPSPRCIATCTPCTRFTFTGCSVELGERDRCTRAAVLYFRLRLRDDRMLVN